MKTTPVFFQIGQLIAISTSKHIQQHVTAQADEEFDKALSLDFLSLGRRTKEIL